MNCDLLSLATPGVASLRPYQPGKPIEELERELGISDIVKLASNENPLGPSQKVLDVLSSISDLSRYPDGNGFTLKRALADFHKISPDQITLGNGSNDILDLITRVFVTERDQVIFSQHAFLVYPIVTRAIGAEAVVTPARNWGHDLSTMLGAVTDKTRLIFIANPNNPTGTWLGGDELRQFMQDTPENIIVCMDQAYFEYAAGPDYPDCIEWLEQFPNLVVARTFSKAYGLAALRIGYSVSHPDVADLMNRIRHPFNVNSVALTVAEVALSDQEHVAKSVQSNNAGMQQLIDGFDSMGIHMLSSKGNFICIDLEQPAMGIYQSLLQEGVIVRPIENYEMPNHLRITIGLREENEKCLSAFANVLSR